MFDFIFDLLGSFLYGSSTGLNTRKIDKNIELLKQQGWFKFRNESAQKKLFNLLDKQLRR